MADLAEQHVISDHERRTNSGNLVAETQSILLEGAAVLTQKSSILLAYSSYGNGRSKMVERVLVASQDRCRAYY